ncbi:MAG: hypothetical protein ACYDGR_17195 [Candidatus Dormibacteria bacterium]
MEIVHRGDVVFVPGDPPRTGQFALLNPSPGCHIGVAPRGRVRLALAWKAGGAAALDVLDAPDWRPPPDAMEEGVPALRSLPGRASVRGSRVTYSAAAVQLRFGPDELWYLCVRRAGTWEIHDPPAADPARLTHLLWSGPQV